MRPTRWPVMSIIVAAILTLVVAACSNDATRPTGPDPADPADPADPSDPSDPGDPNPTPPVQSPDDEIRSTKQRITNPSVNLADMAKQVEGDTGFAFDLYQQIRGEDGNLFYSPHSITLALAMLHGGARGATETQIAQAMSYVLPQPQLHPVFNQLDLELASRGQGSEGADGGKFRLNIVNALWGQRGYPFLDEYLDLLALNYGAGLRLLDFATKPEDSRRTINLWVEQQTEERIKNLLPQGSIDELTRLVLTNAIYFNAAWASPFDEDRTVDDTFRRIDGSQVTVPMMSDRKLARYGTRTDLQAIALDYDGNELSMVIIVPDEGKFDSVEQQLDGPMVTDLVTQLQTSEVQLTMPRFEFEQSLALRTMLSALGMKDAFVPEAADLSGIDGTRDLYVTAVLHKAFVKVNEAGTEAAAATAVVVGATSAGPPPPPPIVLDIDRPFIFLIRDHATGAVLFVGRVLDPS